MHCNIKIKGNLVSLPFSDQDLAYDKQAVQRVYGLGIVKGNENNEFMPKGSATRGESAAFINRMLKVIESNNEKHSRLRVLFIFNTLWKGEKGFEGNKE